MATEQIQVGYLTKDCVIKPGKSGARGDKIERDAVGEEVWNDLAIAGALSTTQPTIENKPKKA